MQGVNIPGHFTVRWSPPPPSSPPPDSYLRHVLLRMGRSSTSGVLSSGRTNRTQKSIRFTRGLTEDTPDGTTTINIRGSWPRCTNKPRSPRAGPRPHCAPRARVHPHPHTSLPGLGSDRKGNHQHDCSVHAAPIRSGIGGVGRHQLLVGLQQDLRNLGQSWYAARTPRWQRKGVQKPA